MAGSFAYGELASLAARTPRGKCGWDLKSVVVFSQSKLNGDTFSIEAPPNLLRTKRIF